VVLLIAGVLFTGGWHIYWPAGVVTMLVLAVGLGLLAVVLPEGSRTVAKRVEGEAGSPVPGVSSPGRRAAEGRPQGRP
jgi:hypothetical protein